MSIQFYLSMMYNPGLGPTGLINVWAATAAHRPPPARLARPPGRPAPDPSLPAGWGPNYPGPARSPMHPQLTARVPAGSPMGPQTSLIGPGRPNCPWVRAAGPRLVGAARCTQPQPGAQVPGPGSSRPRRGAPTPGSRPGGNVLVGGGLPFSFAGRCLAGGIFPHCPTHSMF